MSNHQPSESPIMLILMTKAINCSLVRLTCALGATQGLSLILHFLIIWDSFPQFSQEKTPLSFRYGGGRFLSIVVIGTPGGFSFLTWFTTLQLWFFNHLPNGFRTILNLYLLFETTNTFFYLISEILLWLEDE